MKKICFTILLTFLIVFSGGTLVFAEDYIDGGVYKDSSAPLLTNTVTYINTYDGTVGTPMYFRLIPAMTDTYTIETTGWVDTEGELYDASGNSLEVKDDVVGSNFQIHRELNEGETYYLRVTNFTEIAGDQTILRITGDTGGNLSDPDNAAPTGYSAAIDQPYINNANKTAMSFTFSGAEVGATYNYTISSSGGGENVTGSGTIISNDQQITGIDVSGLADGTLTLSVTLTDQAGNTGAASSDTVSKDTANAAPTATVRPITGTWKVGQELTGHYTYSDVNGDPQGTSTFKWYRSDNSAGLSKAIIAGANAKTYVLSSADEGKYISFEVTPVALTGTTPGTAVESALIGPVAAAPPADITAASVTITAPVLGAVPQNAAALEAATANPDYTVTGLVWNEALTAGGKFKAGRVYTVTVTLTSKNGKKFQDAAFTPTAAGSASVGTTTTAGGALVGNTVSFTVTYAETGALAVFGIAVTTQPTKMSYTEETDDALALNGLQVTETYNDGSTNVVTFTDGTAAGYTASPANGTTLTNAAHNGNRVIITRGSLLYYTDSLTVNVLVNAAVPVITNDLSTVQVEYRKNAAAAALDATATVTDGGTISYQWYSNTISSTAGATSLGVTTAAYTPSTAAVRTTYYYCVVTNTNDDVNGTTTAQTTSAIASIKVKAVGGGGGGGGGGSGQSSTVPDTPVITEPEVINEPAAPWANPFSDVKASDWYYAAVQYAAQNGLMKGTGSDTFSPESVTTRGMIVTILYNLDGSGETEQSTFTDVQPGAYYANAAAWAEKKGIIAGYGNQMFGPDDKITREQLAVMLWKYAGSPAADSQGLDSFKDAGEISAYAQSALAWATQEGIINGKGGSLLDPQGQATRAEAAQIMQSFLQK